jgi:hypothetical protein
MPGTVSEASAPRPYPLQGLWRFSWRFSLGWPNAVLDAVFRAGPFLSEIPENPRLFLGPIG